MSKTVTKREVVSHVGYGLGDSNFCDPARSVEKAVEVCVNQLTARFWSTNFEIESITIILSSSAEGLQFPIVTMVGKMEVSNV